MTTTNAYSDDIAASYAASSATFALVLQDVVESRKAANANAKTSMAHLKLLIVKLHRMHFGHESERLDHQIEQLERHREELRTGERVVPIEVPKTPRTVQEQRWRKPLLERLPNEVQTHLPESPETCSECGGKTKLPGKDVAEQIEYRDRRSRD